MKQTRSAGQIFGALGKALCALLLFLGCQFLVSLAYALTFLIYNALTGSGDVPELITACTGQISLISNVLVLIILLCFSLFRKQNPLSGVSIRPCSRGMILLGIAAAPILYALVTLFFLLLPEAWVENYAEAAASLEGTGAVLALATVVLAPITEEVIFRGYMLSRLQRALPGWVSILVSAALFGACHGHPVWIAYAFVLGLVLGFLALRCGSILPSIAAHLVFNAIGHFLPGLLPENTGDLPVALILLAVGLILCFPVRKTLAYILFGKGTVKHGTDSE